MIDLRNEKCDILRNMTHHVPPLRKGTKTHVSTLVRWAKVGRKGVKLETLRMGARMVTSVEALQRFFEALSAIDAGQGQEPALVATQTPNARRKAVERAERELASAGF